MPAPSAPSPSLAPCQPSESISFGWMLTIEILMLYSVLLVGFLASPMFNFINSSIETAIFSENCLGDSRAATFLRKFAAFRTFNTPPTTFLMPTRLVNYFRGSWLFTTHNESIVSLPLLIPTINPNRNSYGWCSRIFRLYIFFANLNISTTKIVRNAISILSVPFITYVSAMGDEAQAGASPFFILSLIFLRQLYASTIDPSKDTGVSMIHNDLEDSKSFPIEQTTDKCWVLFVLNASNSLPWELKLPACCLLGLQVFKDIARYIAVKKGSQSFATEKNAKLVASYMNQYLGLDGSPQVTEIEYSETPTEFMSGYKYLVMGEEKQRIEPCREKGYNITVTDESQLITLDKVWDWNGEEPQDQENKELCLSFALFKLLRRKFEGIPLTESGSQRALRLLLHGPFKDHKFAFNIVEVQLSFLQEYFFSTIPLCDSLFFIGLLVVLVLFYYGLIVLLIIEISGPIYSQTIYYQTLPIENAERLFVLEISLCLIILFFLLLKDAYELKNYSVSKWRKVTAICQRGSRSRSSAVRHLFNLVSFPKSKYLWGNYNGLNQHSFLKRVESFIEVPDEVKEAIVRSLKENKGQLNSGRTSLNQNGIYDSEIHNACGLESHTERILVWHIVTSHCEAQAQQSEFCSDDINVASCLSRYCAYLVTAVPELIPEETEWIKLVVQRVIRQVCFRNHDISHIGGCYFCWDCMIFRRDIVVSEDEGGLEQALRLVEMGKELGEKLITEIDESRRWKVLADLWTEMLLYMAPSDNVEAHRDSLCKDGQFITHVWALLSDIGINELAMP